MRMTPLVLALLLQASNALAQSIRLVDFRDRVWRHTCIGSVRTHDGTYERRVDDFGVEFFGVGVPIFGDLDGDGDEEAIVPTSCGGGGSGRFSDATIFSVRGGRLREVARLGEGDRSDGGLNDVRIVGGIIFEERLATEHGALDYEYVVTHRRALRGGRLVDVDAATVACEPEHNDGCVLPSARAAGVRFEPGRTDAIRLLPFTADGRVPSLTLRLLAGQVLRVSAWCHGTELAAVEVQPPAGLVVDDRANAGRVMVTAAVAGLYRVSLRARRPVGLCWALMSADARPAP